MENKICGTCGMVFPKTKDYFCVRNQNMKRKNGDHYVYSSFRSDCKNCKAQKEKIKFRKKRFKELNVCTEEEYKKAFRKQIVFKKTKYKELFGIPQSKAQHISAKIDKGYVFTTIEQYDKDVNDNFRKAHLKSRKYKYEHDEKLTKSEINEKQSEIISNSRIALSLGMPVNEVPENILDNIRNVIKLKRFLGLTHSTIATRNINNKYQSKWKQKEI